MSRNEFDLKTRGDDALENDKWNLRRRLLEKIKHVSDHANQGDADKSLDPVFAERLETLIGPRTSPKQQEKKVKQHFTDVLFSARKLYNVCISFLSFVNIARLGRRFSEFSGAINRRILQFRVHPIFLGLKRRSQNAASRIKTEFRFYRRDLLFMPFAASCFAIPLIALDHLGFSLPEKTQAIIALATPLLASLIFGPRIGFTSAISAYGWLAFTIFRPEHSIAFPQILSHWIIQLIGAGSFTLTSIGLGLLSITLKDHLALGRASSAREEEISELQIHLAKAIHPDAIIGLLSTYCQEKLKRNSIFLGLDDIGEGSEKLSNASTVNDIARLFKDAHIAHVQVDRKSYVPRAIHAFKGLGCATYPLVTPSGVIGLLGISMTHIGRLTSIEERSLRMLLITTAYALERIKLKMRISDLENNSMDQIAKHNAMQSLIRNLTATTDHLDAQSTTLRKFINHDPHHELFEPVSFIDRNIGALRNSIAILRDVIRRPN